MTLAPLLVVTGVGGLVALAVSRWWGRGLAGRAGPITGLLALALALVVAVALPTAEAALDPATASPLALTLRSTAWIRLVAIVWCACGLLLTTLTALTGRVPALAGATLIGLTAGTVALASTELLIAAAAAVVAGVVGLLVTAPVPEPGATPLAGRADPEVETDPVTPARPQPIRIRPAPGPAAGAAAVTAVAAHELRSVVVAGVAVIAGLVIVAGVVARPSGTEGGAAELAQAAPLVGLASLMIAAGVALRTGAIPFHLWAARVAEVAPGAALPLLLAWTPLVLTAVAVAAWDAHVATLGVPLAAERAVIIGVAVLTMAAGTLAALVQDDLEHVVGYLAIADSGLILLGLAGADPATVGPSLAWLVILAVSKSALGAWAVAMAARFGSRRLRDLTGWARRAPVLGVAFALTALATFGLPGWLAWDVRRALPELAAGDVAGTLLWLVALAAVVPYARILGAGLGRPTATVNGAPPEWPTTVSRPPAGATAGQAPAAVATTSARTIAAALRANRPLMVSGVVLALGVLGVGLAAGGGGLADASTVPPPAISAQLVGE